MLKNIILSLLLFCSLRGMCGETIKIPYRPDPPISVDGNLEDWATVPFSYKLESKEQVVFQPENWSSAKDLSGTIRFCWRPEGLFIAASIKDDKLTNSGAGAKMFRGDHLELFIDAAPDHESSRKKFGDEQFQFTISPGNLDDDRPVGSFGRIDPEVYRFHPSNKSVIEAMAASRKTTDGWDVEALIPWSELGIKNPRNGHKIRLEAAISDCDSTICNQEKMITISTDKWKFKQRDRLLPAVLADSNGKAASVEIPKIEAIELIKEAAIKPKTYVEKSFELAELPDTVTPVLFIRSRLQSDKNNGDTFALNVYMNGKVVDGSRMMKKTTDMKTRDGGMIKIYSSAFHGFRIPYASSYKEANLPYSAGNRYARFMSQEPRTDFYLDLSGLVEKGKNTLRVGNLNPHVKPEMHVADVKLLFPPRQAKQARVLSKAAKYFVPETATGKLEYKALPHGKIMISTDKASFTGQSYFSIPGGKWVNGSNACFSLDRKISKHDGVIVVEDKFTNLTGNNLGIMQRHEFQVSLPQTKYYINGLPRPAGLKGYYSSANNSSFAGSPAGGIGIVPLNDAFRLHSENYIAGGNGIGLCDRMLVIGPKASYTAQWAIAANSTGSYWDFINALRQYLGVNFKLDGPVAMLRCYPPYSEWPLEKVRKFFELKSAFFGIAGLTFRTVYKGKKLPYLFNHGLAARLGIPELKKNIDKWRKADQTLKILQYFHCYIDSSDNADTDFADSKTLDTNGKHAVYGKYFYQLFYPTLTNKFGMESEKTIDMLMNELKVDGIFWDEISYSMVPYHYGKPWDECSGDIDMRTHEVIKLKSSVSLISKSWRVKQAKRILERGYLMGNGALYCNDMRKLNIPCFAETAQSTFCARTHLYTPIALGDHLSEATEQDAYNNMLNALDYGCVYYWYGDQVYPTHKTLTDKMYPVTPIRLGPGYIIGRERILTRVSGFFGWNDSSAHQVFVFDEKGKQVEGHKVETKVVDGKTFSEINLWPNWSAAIIRKP